MAYDWHVAHQALSEVIYIDTETKQLVSRLSKSELQQYHDIGAALNDNNHLMGLVSKELPTETKLLNLIIQNRKLLEQLKLDILKSERTASRLIELKKKDINKIAPILKGFDNIPAMFEEMNAQEKIKQIEYKLIQTTLKEDIIKGKDVEEMLLAHIHTAYLIIGNLGDEHNSIKHQFRALVRRLVTIKKYELWNLEYIKPIAGFTKKELEYLKYNN